MSHPLSHSAIYIITFLCVSENVSSFVSQCYLRHYISMWPRVCLVFCLTMLSTSSHKNLASSFSLTALQNSEHKCLDFFIWFLDETFHMVIARIKPPSIEKPVAYKILAVWTILCSGICLNCTFGVIWHWFHFAEILIIDERVSKHPRHLRSPFPIWILFCLILYNVHCVSHVGSPTAMYFQRWVMFSLFHWLFNKGDHCSNKECL